MLDLLAGLSSSVLQTLFLGCLLHLLPASTAQIHSLGVARRGQVSVLPSQPTQKSGNVCFPTISRSAPAGSPDRDGVVVSSRRLGSGVRQTRKRTLFHRVLSVLSNKAP